MSQQPAKHFKNLEIIHLNAAKYFLGKAAEELGFVCASRGGRAVPMSVDQGGWHLQVMCAESAEHPPTVPLPMVRPDCPADCAGNRDTEAADDGQPPKPANGRRGRRPGMCGPDMVLLLLKGSLYPSEIVSAMMDEYDERTVTATIKALAVAGRISRDDSESPYSLSQ